MKIETEHFIITRGQEYEHQSGYYHIVQKDNLDDILIIKDADMEEFKSALKKVKAKGVKNSERN